MEVPLPLGNIGRYRLVDRLATGGMADVFLAVDPDHDEDPLVIKRILPHLAQDDSFVRMFLQEARIAMAVRHPHVVHIHKLGEHDGLPYLVMDYIPGLTFRQLAVQAQEQRRRLPAGVAVDLIAQACEGAQAVHDTVVGEHDEIVHRDLCPHNLMVDEEGVVKLLDFGIAKAARGMDTTRTGALKGKIAYLAPEQVRREPVDRRTDLWTLSVVAWELLAGRRMFAPDSSDYDLMQAIVGGQLPRLEEARPDLAGLVVETVHRNLHLDPDARFASADEFRENLVEAARIAEISTHTAATRAFVRAVLSLDQSPDSEVTDASGARITRQEDVVPLIPQDTPPSPTSTPVSTAPSGGVRWPLVGAGFGVAALALFAGGVGIGAFLLSDRPPQGPPVTVTWAPVMPPEAMIEELEPLRADLEATLDRPVTFQVAPTYQAAGRLLSTGKTDFAVLPPYLYLTVQERMGSDLELLVFTEHDGGQGVDGVIIGGAELDWQGVDSLRDQTFCFTDPTITTGYVLPRQWMRDRGLDPEHDLAESVLSGNHHQVIADVASGRCAAGATFSAALRSAFDVDVDAERTRQLEITGRTPNDAVCAGPDTPDELTGLLTKALLAWDPQALHGQRFIGPRQHLTGFIPAQDQAYDPLRRAVEGESAASRDGGAGTSDTDAGDPDVSDKADQPAR